MTERYRVGIDTGGTFTDLLAVAADGRRAIVKVPSTPASPHQSLLDGLRALRRDHGIGPDQIEAVLHGTTVGINALLQGRYPTVGLITTRGFRHMLELARQTVHGERGAVYTWEKPAPLVSLEHVFEVDERMDARGAVVRSLEHASVAAAAAGLKSARITHVAVCLLNSYANRRHEDEVREQLEKNYPGCSVTLSADTLAEFREYERAVATIINALLGPVVGEYIGRVEAGMLADGVSAPLFIMKSAGGVTTASRARQRPVESALSGPAAAVVGMATVGREAGFRDLVTFDMGGTSTDVGVVENGEPAIRHEATIGAFPLRTPTIDVVSVGAGGGSIAWVAPGGFARVGPQSTGADPGPACYGRGGMEPTISDANLYLGRLGTELAGGSLKLDPGLAALVMERHAARVGLEPLTAAAGILEVASFNMADAIRQMSVRRGRDPRQFALVAGGGAGPLHAGRLAELLSMPTIIIPAYPGVGCATGVLSSDVREDAVSTEFAGEDQLTAAGLAARYAALVAEVTRRLTAQGFATDAIGFERSADMRYKGQRTELVVAGPAGELGADAVSQLTSRFHDSYRAAFDYDYRGSQPTELVNLRVTGVVRLPHVSLTPPQGQIAAAPEGTRRTWFAASSWVEMPIYQRWALPAGFQATGPLGIDQYDSTTVVYPGHRVAVHPSGHLLIDVPAN